MAFLELVWGSSREPREEPEGRPGGSGRGKWARMTPLAVLAFPGPPGLPSGSPPGSLELPQTSLKNALLKCISKVFQDLEEPSECLLNACSKHLKGFSKTFLKPPTSRLTAFQRTLKNMFTAVERHFQEVSKASQRLFEKPFESLSQTLKGH